MRLTNRRHRSSRYKGAQWIKSSLSYFNSNCVEVADLGNGVIGIRDSKLGDRSPVLRFNAADLASLTGSAREGIYDGLTAGGEGGG